MGAWGYRPRDCDGAWDLYAEVNSNVRGWLVNLFKKKLTGTRGHEGRWERIGLAQLLHEQLNLPFLPCVVDDIDFLLTMRRLNGKLWGLPQTRRALRALRAKAMKSMDHGALQPGSFSERIGEIVLTVHRRKRRARRAR